MFQNLLWVWDGDGLNECEISRPEILSQSALGASLYKSEINEGTKLLLNQTSIKQKKKRYQYNKN